MALGAVNFSPFRNTKKLGGDMEITAELLLHMSLNWGKSLIGNDGPRIPSSVLETMVDAYYQQRISLALQKYLTEMNTVIQNFPKGMSTSDLLDAESTARTVSLHELGTPSNSMGSPENFYSYKGQLEAKFAHEFRSFLSRNESNKQIEQEKQATERARLAEVAATATAERRKAEIIRMAHTVLDNARNEVAVAKTKLETVHSNQYKYTSNVEVRQRSTARIFGINWSPPFYAYHMEAKYDPAKYEAAVAEAQRILSEREKQLEKALEDLEIARS